MKPTKDEDFKAAVVLTRSSAPALVGALEALVVSAENEAAMDHDKVVAATAKLASFRPSEMISESETTAESRVVGKYSILEYAASAIANAARATIAALQGAARAQAATPQLTRK